MAKRRNFSAALKAQVAIGALRGDQTLAELAARHGVHPNLITKWKRQAAEGMVDVFSGKTAGRDGSHEAERFFALLSEKQLRRSIHRSTKDLEAAILRRLGAHDEHPLALVRRTSTQLARNTA